MASATSNLTKLRVVHVDDNIYDLQHVKQVLEKNDTSAVPCQFVVESVRTLEGFLEAVESHSPDICLVDIHLAEDEKKAEGISLVSKVKKLAPNAVIMMRSNAEGLNTLKKPALRIGTNTGTPSSRY